MVYLYNYMNMTSCEKCCETCCNCKQWLIIVVDSNNENDINYDSTYSIYISTILY